MESGTDDHLLENLRARFTTLSPQLRKAARFVIDNPEDVALHSMRGVAARADVHPNVMLRLARDLGFQSYEPFRQHFQSWIVGRSSGEWKARAETLRRSPPGEASTFVRDYIDQETANLQNTFSPDVAMQLQEAANLISEARSVYVLGLRSLFSASFYFNYVCRLFMSKTVLMTAIGGTFADELRDVTDADVLVAFSYQPYAQDTVRAVAFAREKGARTIIITDSKVSPVLGTEGVNIVLSTAAKSLFPTLVPAVAAAQILAALLVSRGSDDTLREIERSELQLERFGVYMR